MKLNLRKVEPTEPAGARVIRGPNKFLPCSNPPVWPQFPAAYTVSYQLTYLIVQTKPAEFPPQRNISREVFMTENEGSKWKSPWTRIVLLPGAVIKQEVISFLGCPYRRNWPP